MNYKRLVGTGLQYGAGLAINSYYNYRNPGDSQDFIATQPLSQMAMGMSRTRSRTITRVRRRRRGKKGGGGGYGIIGPNIPRPSKPRKASKYALYGSHGEDEVYGNISKPNMAYIGVTSAKATAAGTVEAGATSSWSGSVVYHCAAALLRKIFKDEWNEEIFRHDQRVLPKSYGVYKNDNTQLWTAPSIVFIYKDTPMHTGPCTYDIGYSLHLNPNAAFDSAPTDPYKNFADLCYLTANYVIGGDPFGAVAGTPNSARRSLYGYAIVESDRDVSYLATTPAGVYDQSGQIISGVRRLDEQYMVAYSTAEIYLQNTTVADSTSETNTLLADRIDSNPLDCVIMKFKNPYPKVRNDAVILNHTAHTYNGPRVAPSVSRVDGNEYAYELGFDTNADGVIVPADTMAGNWEQLPKPDQFIGCTGYNKFKLQPGEMRKMRLKFKFEGSINKFIQGFRTISEVDSTRYNGKDAFGTSVLFACEKVMSTGASANVSLNYQVSYWAGAYMKKRKHAVMQSMKKVSNYTGGVDAATSSDPV